MTPRKYKSTNNAVEKNTSIMLTLLEPEDYK